MHNRTCISHTNMCMYRTEHENMYITCTVQTHEQHITCTSTCVQLVQGTHVLTCSFICSLRTRSLSIISFFLASRADEIYKSAHIHPHTYVVRSQREKLVYCMHFMQVCTVHMYVRMYVSKYVHTYVRTYVLTYLRTYYMLTYLRTYVLTYVLHAYVLTYVRTYVRKHVCTYIQYVRYVCTHVQYVRYICTHVQYVRYICMYICTHVRYVRMYVCM